MTALLRRYRELRAFLLVVIACTLASAGMLPVWAQLAEIEGPHACHCAADHHDCFCPRCGTDPDAKGHRSVETLTGRCGDDDIAFGGRAIIAVVPAVSAVVLAPRYDVREAPPVTSLTTQLLARPPTPPPRSV